MEEWKGMCRDFSETDKMGDQTPPPRRTTSFGSSEDSGSRFAL